MALLPGCLLLLPVVTGCTAAQPAQAPPGASAPVPSTAAATPEASVTAVTGTPSPDQVLADDVVAAVVARLSVMPAVAHAKWSEDLPVRDRPREREVTAAFVEAAASQGVPRSMARAVIRDQIDAAANVQQSLLDAWDSGAYPVPDGPAPDLAADLRPGIDAATTDLADALAYLVESGIPADWPAILARAQGQALESLPDGVTAVDLSLALTALSEIPSDAP